MIKGFMSYSQTDGVEYVKRLHTDIQDICTIECGRPVKIYFDMSSRRNGSLPEELKEEIEAAEFYVLVISDHYFERGRTSLAELGRIEESLKSKDRRKLVIIEWRPLNSDSQRRIQQTKVLKEQKRIKFHNVWREDRELFEKKFKGIIAPHLIDLVVEKDTPDVEASLVPRIKDLTSQIFSLATKSDEHPAIRNQLTINVLEDVISELQALNSTQYDHQISLDYNFVRRAEAIFKEAEEVYAVSLDVASSFWLNEMTKDSARRYTAVQPPRTFRLFVFSSPESMLRHRFVLAAHFEAYGEQGRVLVTTRDHWDYYKDKILSRNIQISPDEDFGVLKYQLQDRLMLAVLSGSALKFQNINNDVDYSKFLDDSSGVSTRVETLDGAYEIINFEDDSEDKQDSRRFWIWEREFKLHDESWFGFVRAVFDGDIDFGANYSSNIVHNVLISPPLEKDKLEDFKGLMKNTISELLKIKDRHDERLIKGIWFGESFIGNNPPRDGKYKNELALDRSWHDKWKYCLSISFESQGGMDEYYAHEDHSQIRRRLYAFFEPSVDILYRQADQFLKNGNSEESKRLTTAVEQMMTRHFMRLDYAVPSQYDVYRAIEAADF